MTDKIDNEYAFPQMQKCGDVAQSTGGLTMRDWFAAMALQGILANSHPKVVDEFIKSYTISDSTFAENAYLLADEMIKWRDEK